MSNESERPNHGTRYEFVLHAHLEDGTVEYDVTVATRDRAIDVVLKLTATTAEIVRESEPMTEESRAQLLALAKTIGKRSNEEGWPRRIARWRQPGVR